MSEANMGAFLTSNSKTHAEKNSDGFPFGNADFSVLDDLLVDILVNVSPVDLLKNCRAVCKEWKELIDGHSIWKIKCQRDKRFIPSVKFANELPNHFYRQIYFHDPYNRNLIINPCGEDGLNGWKLTANGGDGFTIESPPGGAESVPSEVGSQSCFATSFLPCTKHQIIDLFKEGIPKDVMQLKTTKIQICEWYAARFDCASEYFLTVLLLTEDCDITDSNSYPLGKLDEFKFNFYVEQWVGKEWHKVSHEFDNVSNVRYVLFEHHGKDRQFWAGHYGTKMTGATVKIIV